MGKKQSIMNTYTCACSATLFFENTQCLTCQREVGWCPSCRAIVALEPADAGGYRCCGCAAVLAKCHNYAVEKVCNRCVVVGAGQASADSLCDYCRFNDTIPDLNVAGNRQRWYRLEQGKRRLLYALDFLGLPYGTADDGVRLPLSFDFKADPDPAVAYWQPMADKQQIFTGHAHGKITIKLREAEPAEREKLRVEFQEAHRTIIGHFRHEISHYYWEMLVQGVCENAFTSVFGDHNYPPYADALQRYYQQGPPADWADRFVSAYASSHPWEDFAETFATYLDVVSVLDTADNLRLGSGVDPRTAELDAMLVRYRRIGLVLNEMNRDMGLKDLVPEVLGAAVVQKMRFIHDLVRGAAALCHFGSLTGTIATT